MGQSRVRTEATALTSSQPSTARVHWVSATLVILFSMYTGIIRAEGYFVFLFSLILNH